MRDELRRYMYSLMTDEAAPAAQGPSAEVFKVLLSALSFIYLCCIEVAKYLYRANILPSFRPKCKVISVGNITLGGTGKTPLIIAIARKLKNDGKKVVILTRGYMKDKETGIADEALLFERSLGDIPVIVGRDRVKSARTAEAEFSPDVILLDDGFQHWRLKRDLDIVTINGKNPFGNGWLIPRGILRELKSSLERADVIVVTKGGPVTDEIIEINNRADVFSSSYGTVDLSGINGKKVAMACAIGDPSSFEDTILSLGAQIVRKFIFMDHHLYSESDVKRMVSETVAAGADTVVITEKDIVKLSRLVSGAGVKFVTVGIEMKISDKEKFFGRLDSIFTR